MGVLTWNGLCFVNILLMNNVIMDFIANHFNYI